MKTKNLIITLLLAASTCGLSAQEMKQGIIVAGGIGSLINDKPSESVLNTISSTGTFDASYKFDAAVGYKFRIQPETKPFFYDLDFYVGLRRFNYEYSNYYNNQYNYGDYSDQIQGKENFSKYASISYYYFSANPSFNYKIYKGLHAGIGAEPTLYFGEGASSGNKWKFDVPVTARIGYDFHFMDVAIGYKYGLLNALEKEVFKSGRFSNLQLQVFIPF